MNRIPSNFPQIIAGWLVTNVEAVLIMCTPLLAPLPSMFAVIRAFDKAGWQHANLVGGIVEIMGLAAGAFMGLVEGHNQRHPDRQISHWWGRGLFAFYFIVVEALILSSDPNVVSALLPGLTLVGSVIVGLRDLMRRADDQQAETMAKADNKTAAERERQDAQFQLDLDIKRKEAEQQMAMRAAEHAQKLELERRKVETKLSTRVATVDNGVDSQAVATTGNTEVDSEKVDKLKAFYVLQPKASLRKAAAEVGLSHTGVSKILDRLESDGVIHRNGNGVEILTGV